MNSSSRFGKEFVSCRWSYVATPCSSSSVSKQQQHTHTHSTNTLLLGHPCGNHLFLKCHMHAHRKLTHPVSGVHNAASQERTMRSQPEHASPSACSLLHSIQKAAFACDCGAYRVQGSVFQHASTAAIETTQATHFAFVVLSWHTHHEPDMPTMTPKVRKRLELLQINANNGVPDISSDTRVASAPRSICDFSFLPAQNAGASQHLQLDPALRNRCLGASPAGVLPTQNTAALQRPSASAPDSGARAVTGLPAPAPPLTMGPDWS